MMMIWRLSLSRHQHHHLNHHHHHHHYSQNTLSEILPPPLTILQRSNSLTCDLLSDEMNRIPNSTLDYVLHVVANNYKNNKH